MVTKKFIKVFTTEKFIRFSVAGRTSLTHTTVMYLFLLNMKLDLHFTDVLR